MKEKAEHEGLTDLTEETAEDASDSELFAHLVPREPRHASGLHLRPRKDRADLAKLGALLPSTVGRTSISAPRSSAPPRPFDDDALTPPRQALPPRPGAAPRRKPAVVAIAAGVAALLLVALAVVVSRGGGTGALMVTVSGPGSRLVTGFDVLVDGQQRCSESPCRISAIEAGTHLVDVRGPGFEPTAALAVTVSRGAESVLNVTLSPVAKPPSVAQPLPVTKPPPAPLPAVAAVAPAPRAIASATVPRPPPTPAPASTGSAAGAGEAAFGMLRIVSLPVGNVLVDGRPIGQTPRVVRVTPGAHRVAVVAGEQRRAQTVTVAPGATEVVSVRF